MGATVTAGSSIAVRGERRRRWGNGSTTTTSAGDWRGGGGGGARAGRGRVGRGSARTTIARARETSRDGGSSYARSRRRGDGDDGDEDESDGDAETPAPATGRVACRTATGAALATVLARDGWDAFERASTETLCALVEGGFTAGSGVESEACDRDCVVGRAAMTRMEVEDVVYLRAAREVFEASDAAMASEDGRRESGNGGDVVVDARRGRLSLVRRCQKLQEILPEGSDEFMINLVLRVVENVSKHSRRVGATHEMTSNALADVYAKCASFGYFLQASERRLELEHYVSTNVDVVSLEKVAYPGRLARYGVLRSNLRAMEGSTHAGAGVRAAGYEASIPLRVQGGIPIERGMVSLKEYIDAMGPSARANAARIASVEAAEVLQLHVSNLFTNECSRGMTSLGGFRRKPSRSSDGTPDDRFSVHVHQLKHIVIEACAFGAALARTEQAIDEAHGLDPASKPLLTRLH